MFRSFSIRFLFAAAILLPLLLIGSAWAETPVFTVTFDKDSYKAGDTVKAHYKIDFDGEYTEIRGAWGIVTNWEDGSCQWNGENTCDLEKLEGDVLFKPQYGEGVIFGIDIWESTGEWHTLESDPVRVKGFAPLVPKCTISFDKAAYDIGEKVTAHYKIDFVGDYTEIRGSWGIVTDWENGSSQWNGENTCDLKSLEGSVSFKPQYGEGVIFGIDIWEPTGEWHIFESDPVRVYGDISVDPKCTITFDGSSYEMGDKVTAYYKIDFDGEYTEIRGSWGIVTDWKDGSSQWNGENTCDLKSLEGSASFKPQYGEGVIFGIDIWEPTGEWHIFESDPVRVTKYVAMTTNLPKSLTKIEDEAFAGAKFSKVVCPDGLLSIGSRAFANCEKMQCITIPASVTNIAEDAFEGCTSLTTIIAKAGSTAAAFAQDHGYEIDYL